MASPDQTKSDAKDRDLIVVDLGTKKTRQIKRLRRGKGKLIDKVKQAIDELRATGTITGTVQPVVVVVTEETAPWDFMRMMG